jgi:glycine hydroxymethyltransferase
MLLVDLRGAPIDALAGEDALDRAHIAVNYFSLPGEDSDLPAPGSGGLRLGTPAVTTRGLLEPEIRALSDWVADLLEDPSDARVMQVRRSVRDMCAAFPVYGEPSSSFSTRPATRGSER